MVNRNLIRGLDLSEEQWQRELTEALEGAAPDEIDWGGEEIAVNQIVEGKVLRLEGDFVLVDVGYKSEGMIPQNEWEDPEAPPEAARPASGRVGGPAKAWAIESHSAASSPLLICCS